MITHFYDRLGAHRKWLVEVLMGKPLSQYVQVEVQMHVLLYSVLHSI